MPIVRGGNYDDDKPRFDFINVYPFSDKNHNLITVVAPWKGTIRENKNVSKRYIKCKF